MIIFGGIGNDSAAGQGTVLLGDEWEIDLDPSYNVSVVTDNLMASCTVWMLLPHMAALFTGHGKAVRVNRCEISPRSNPSIADVDSD